ncbi:MAG: murein biosynthesis integral membrane protein MurJ [Nautiliaceae bacterium]
MIKQIIINFLGIFSSRILGFIRDLLSASILGANIYSDIFFTAFKLPNLFRRIFAEGAFTQSFLPSFAKEKNKPRFALKVFVYFLSIILLLTIFINIFSYEVTSLIAPGFSQEAKKIASKFVAINFWYLDLIFIVTFFSTLLQYKNHFLTTAFSTIFLNLSLILALLISKGEDKETIVFYLSIGVIVGGIFQVIVHLIAAKQYKILKFLYIGAISKKKTSLKTFKKHFLPSLFGNSTAQLSSFIDTFLASFLTSGSISYLYYANRLFQLPFALFVIATSSVVFPKITKYLHSNQEEKAIKILKKSFWFLFYALIFATIIGAVLSEEIVKLLFQRGAFEKSDSKITAYVFVMYLIGLIPLGLNKLFSSYLYATHRHLKAAKISFFSVLVNVIFSIILIFPLKVLGLALASSISGWILFYFTLKEFGFRDFFGFFKKRYVLGMILAILISIIMAILFKEVLIFFKGAV